jgi:hypothetical protein
MKRNETGWACRTHGEIRNAHTTFVGKDGGSHFGEFGAGGLMLLTFILTKQDVSVWNGFIWFRRVQWRVLVNVVMNLRVRKKKGGETVDQLGDYQLPRNLFSSMDNFKKSSHNDNRPLSQNFRTTENTNRVTYRTNFPAVHVI